MKGIKNFFKIRKEAKTEMAKINKKGFGYVNPKIIDILHKKGGTAFPSIQKKTACILFVHLITLTKMCINGV